MGADARGLAAARARRWFVNLQLRDRTQVGDGDGDRMRRGVALARSLPLNTTPPLVAEEEPSARLAPLWFGRAATRSTRWLSPPREPLLVRLSPLGRDRTSRRLLSCASSVYPLPSPRRACAPLSYEPIWLSMLVLSTPLYYSLSLPTLRPLRSLHYMSALGGFCLVLC